MEDSLRRAVDAGPAAMPPVFGPGGGIAYKPPGDYRPCASDADPGAAHEPDPLEARVIALEARVAAMEAVVGMALARPRSIDR